MMSTRFLITLILLVTTLTSSVVLARCSHSDHLSRTKREAVSGDQLKNEEELQKARLEFIKLQILQRLGMSKAPKIKRKQVDIAACE